METVGSSKLKNSLNSYLAQIKGGARFIITEHGRPVAKLIPLDDDGSSTPEAIVTSLIGSGLLSIESGLENGLKDPEPIVSISGSPASTAIIDDRRNG